MCGLAISLAVSDCNGLPLLCSIRKENLLNVLILTYIVVPFIVTLKINVEWNGTYDSFVALLTEQQEHGIFFKDTT